MSQKEREEMNRRRGGERKKGGRRGVQGAERSF
jgi:hypothetical protein